MKKSTILLAVVALSATACGKGSTGPTVASVTVAPSSATLTALGETKQFSALAKDGGGNAVMGESVAWTSSDETVATVSSSGLAAAVGAGTATITATVAGVMGTASVTVSLAQPSPECTDTTSVSLNAGDETSFSGTSTCVVLPSGNNGDAYRVTVLEPTTSQTSDTAHVTLQVTGMGVIGAPPAQGAPTAAARESLPFLSLADQASLRRSLQIERNTERLHLAMRAKERQLFDYLSSQHKLSLPAPRSVTTAVAPAPSPTKMTFDITTDGCTTSAAKKKTGILVYENNDLAFYQDSTQRVSKPVSQSNLQMMGDYYSSYAKNMITSYFGRVSDIDGNGKVLVFISPVVGSGEAAFVWAGDFYPTAQCSASNYGEIIYFSNDIIAAMSQSNPSYQALGTLAHEMKHVVSLYNRLEASISANSDQFQPGWVEEGTAEIAGEMSSRIAWAANGGPAVGAKVTRSDMATLTGGINVTPEDYGVILRMARTIYYLSTQPNSLTATALGADSLSNVYGSGWNFHRWLGDAYGGAGNSPEADSSFFRVLTDSTTPPEPGSLQTRTGKSFDQLLEEYVTAMSLTGTGAPEPARTFTTYDLVSATSNLLKSQPPGVYPWPVTQTGFQTGVYVGPIGAGGVRVHDFVSNGTGTGALLHLSVNLPGTLPTPKLVVVRLQ